MVAKIKAARLWGLLTATKAKALFSGAAVGVSKRQAGVGWGAWLQKQGVLNAERKVSFQRIVQVNGPFLFLKPAAAASTWSGSTSPAPPHTGVHTRVHTRAHTLSHSLTHTLTHALTLPHTLTHTAAALSTAGFRAASGAAPEA